MKKYLIAAMLMSLNLLSSGATGAPETTTDCPPSRFINNVNLAKNPSFETVGASGSPVSWHGDRAFPAVSAAKDWYMHSAREGTRVNSMLTTANVPGPGGFRMLHYLAGGTEGGVYQPLRGSPAKLMFSAWVLVVKGHVALQASHAGSGPAAWSTKTGQWEQLRVCTSGAAATEMLAIYNHDTNGGDFFVDRVEVREIH